VSAQALEALVVADRRRIEGAKFRRNVGERSREDGLRALAEALEEPCEIVGSIRLDRFLRSVHRVGSDKADRIVVHAGVNPRRVIKKVRELTERERMLLVAELHRRAE
jgi:hypothetical protein